MPGVEPGARGHARVTSVGRCAGPDAPAVTDISQAKCGEGAGALSSVEIV